MAHRLYGKSAVCYVYGFKRVKTNGDGPDLERLKVQNAN